ncbi:histone H4 transcription factor-like [Ochlerotatus camptorhynchus]|uniref:histone H4 transcription factor-like n=1 Tax=Ochlerotatus camptorhynchus TaxID=644619 RepID=UPI0031D81EAF
MGRKRKTRAPIKITDKQVKLEDSNNSTDAPLAVVKKSSSPEPQHVIAQCSVPPNPNKKPWVKKCRQWVDEQQQEAEPPPLEPDVDDEPPMDEPAELPLGTDVPLRQMLKDYSEKEILNSVMYECEWLKCGFETTEDLKYITHVEAHVYQYLAEQGDSEDLVCFWDLCEFRTSSPSDLESHVHFHVYHNRVKTHGASLSSIIRIPKCNGDSRRRNCIDSFKTKFRCEWNDCDEVINKVHLFFLHVNCHVQDQFPIDRKSTKQLMQCQWVGCKQMYMRSSIALEHTRRHTTERTIGCYTCGAMFVSRLKYIDHCKRQVEYHNREFSCTGCDKLFATKQLMIDHRNIHDKKFSCTLCPMKWPSKKALATHIRYRHVTVKPFKCQICSHRTVTKADLEEHVLTHDKRRMFRCEEFGCEATYKCQRSLKKHVDSIHYGAGPGIYACHLCASEYKAGASLSKHLVRAHQFERPPGYNRFTYRANRHGILQLSSITQNNDDEPSPDPSPLPKPRRQRSAPIKKEAEKTDDKTDDDTSEPGTFTSFSIEKLEPIAKNTFSIELKAGVELPTPVYRKQTSTVMKTRTESTTSMDGETSDALPLQMKIEIEEPPATSSVVSRNIDDFTVMKRYLKTEKPVVISYEEMDSSGSVIRSETVQTTELNREKLLQGNM